MGAVEDPLGIQVPRNARILRNLIEGIQYVQGHVIHFFHLHALDWVDTVSAVGADPAATANLMAVAHDLEALDWQRDVIRAHAILGSKNPHLQTHVVGGMATPIDPNSQAALNADKLALLQKLFARAREFVDQVNLPGGLAVAPFYLDWAGYGLRCAHPRRGRSGRDHDCRAGIINLQGFMPLGRVPGAWFQLS